MASEMIEKLPPHNIEAEEAVLGSILVDPGALDDVAAVVQAADFYREKNAWVFEACMASQEGLNQITVAQELAQKGRLEPVGGAGYLSLLVERLPTSLHAEHYAAIVHRLAQHRRFISAAGQIAAIGYAVEGDEAESYAKIRRIVDGLMTHGSSELHCPAEQAELVMQIASDWTEKRESVSFGYPNLDHVTGGMNGGDLVIIGARTSVGKSQLLLEIALHNAYRRRCVLFASVEMSVRQLLERQISMATKKEIAELRRGQATDKNWQEIGDLSQTISSMPLYVMSGKVTLEGLTGRAKTLKETADLQLVCFDHVQFVARKLGKQYGDTLREKVGYVTNSLKSLAEELDIPVLAACQLSRAVESREDHMPMLADFKESGSIEEDADLALLLHRPELYKKCSEEDKGFMFIRIGKDRQGGRSDTVRLKWYPEFKRYGTPVSRIDEEMRQGHDTRS